MTLPQEKAGEIQYVYRPRYLLFDDMAAQSWNTKIGGFTWLL
jgi:hypothetical protein